MKHVSSSTEIFDRDGISHFVVFDDPNTGLMVHSHRGRRSNAERLKCPADVEEEVRKLRNELSYEKGTKIVLLLSLATDEMIRLVMMYPETFFMDVTGQTNRQKRDMFLMAVKDSAGKVFPGNMTVVPSGKAWVFHTIYQHAFRFLYGDVTISRNRLALTDEDQSEYGSFENCIKSMEIYKDSLLMLCTFHAIWKPFKERIYPLLPYENGKLSPKGRLYGKYIVACCCTISFINMACAISFIIIVCALPSFTSLFFIR